MSLGIVFKGAEGIVLAADSRVTLKAQPPGENVVIPATFDNATKLLRVAGQEFVGAVTYGLGALGQRQPRTAHSFIPEFEAELTKEGNPRLSVEEFGKRLSGFFMGQWTAQQMPDPAALPPGHDMVFFVGGYDEGDPYGKVFEFHVPTKPDPQEWHPDSFGMVWGGQREITDRIIAGFDTSLPDLVQKLLNSARYRKGQAQCAFKGNPSGPDPISVPSFTGLRESVDISLTRHDRNSDIFGGHPRCRWRNRCCYNHSY